MKNLADLADLADMCPTDHKRDLNIVKISEWSARESLTNYVDYGSLKFILIQYF